MQFSLDELRGVFDATTLQHGRAYYNDEHVESLNINVSGDLVSAVAHGNRAQPYRCIVNLDRNARCKLVVRGRCSASSCKRRAC